MNPNYLDFEQPIADLEMKIEELQGVGDNADLNLGEEINRLREKSTALTEKIYADLSAWDIVRVARHPQRPYSLDYIPEIFTEFDELHGDRHFADDKAIVGGVARLDGRPVMVIGQEKGRAVKDKVYRNFGMPKPEGYRKAMRLMEMAERFQDAGHHLDRHARSLSRYRFGGAGYLRGDRAESCRDVAAENATRVYCDWRRIFRWGARYWRG